MPPIKGRCARPRKPVLSRRPNISYDHDAEDGFSGQNYFPETMKRGIYYTPVERGYERELKKRIDYFAKLRAKRP